MKKMIALVLSVMMLCGAFAALAEDAQTQEGLKINTLFEDGCFIIQMDVGDDLGWIADDMAQDDSVVALAYADNLEGTFVARYEPTGEGDVTVGVRHYLGIACDRALTWDLRVADGAVQEVIGGSDAAVPPQEEQDPYMVGEWVEAENGFAQMTIEKNQTRGWDVVIAAPLTHGAYIFKTTIYYDCDMDCFVYDKGKFWDVPVTDEENPELGEAKIAGTLGQFAIESEESALRLSWYDAESPENEIVFERADAAE